MVGLRIVLSCALLVTAAFAGPTVAQAAPVPPEDFRVTVAAVSASQGRVTVTWQDDPASTFAVFEVVAGQLVPRSGATPSSWRSDTERPGTHVYRVTRTVSGETGYSEQTVVVPSRQLFGIQWRDGDHRLATIAPPNGNAWGTSFGLRTVGRVAVSPTRRVLAATVRDATGTALWLVSPLGSPLRQLTRGPWDSQPAFSPDGRTVAFVHRETGDGVPAVHLVDATTTGTVPVPLPGGANASHPAWTPDGGSVVAEIGDSASTEPTEPLIVIRRADGQRAVIAGTEGGQGPVVSRTGRVAFWRPVPGGTPEVLVTTLTGGTPERWSPAPQPNRTWFAPAWDPQGNALAFISGAPYAGPTLVPMVVTGPGQVPVNAGYVADAFEDFTQIAWFDTADAAPTATLSVPAYTRTTTTTATVSVADSDDAIGGLTVECRVDAGSWVRCAPGAWQVPAQRPGAHTLAVRVTDPNGRSTIVTRPWTVDQTAPAVAVGNPVQPFTLATAIPVSWSGSDSGAGVAYYQVRWTRAPYNGGPIAWQYPSGWQRLTTKAATLTGALPSMTYCFGVRAVDRLGNVSAWSASKCSSVAMDDRWLAASSGWARVASSAFYQSTATRTTGAGRYLGRPGAQASRLAVVATRCPSCGTVAVYIGGSQVGRISLYAPTTQHRVVLPLPRFTYRSGTVIVKALTSGRLVQIDALGVSRY